MQYESHYQKYINFNILDDLQASDINVAQKLANSTNEEFEKCASEKEILKFDNIYQIDISLSDTIGLNNARKLCNRIAYILDLSEEIVQYTKPEFHSKYQKKKKNWVLRL